MLKQRDKTCYSIYRLSPENNYLLLTFARKYTNNDSSFQKYPFTE